MRLLKLLSVIGIISATVMGQSVVISTTFTDPAFRAYVSDNFDIDKDGILSASELAAVKTINVSGKGIKDLPVFCFTSMTDLDCSNNELTSLVIPSTVPIKSLNCFGNKLTSINTMVNMGLKTLNCSNNKLTTLDVNTGLTTLNCSNNKFTELDLTNNTELITLDVSNNRLTWINLSSQSQDFGGVLKYFSGSGQTPPTIILYEASPTLFTGFGGLPPSGYGNRSEFSDPAISWYYGLRSTDRNVTSVTFKCEASLGAARNDFYLTGTMKFAYSNCADDNAHNWSGQGTIRDAATCNIPALHYKKCVLCNVDTPNENDVISVGNPLGHDYSLDGGQLKAATCFEPQLLKSKCSRCFNETGDPSRAGAPKLEHDFTAYGPTISMATCLHPQLHWAKCTKCLSTGPDTLEYGVKLPHNYTLQGSLKSEANCQSPALYYKKCTGVCAADHPTETIEVGESLGHDFSALGTVLIKGNCETETPTICKAKCVRCEVESETFAFEAPCDYDPTKPCVHDFTELGTVITKGNCATQTKTTCKAKCSKCGVESETITLQGACDKIDPKDCVHIFVRILTPVMGATCTTAPIYRETCSVCDKEQLIFDGESLGHNFTVLGSIVIKGDCETGTATICKAKCGRCLTESETLVLSTDDCDYDPTKPCVHEFTELGTVITKGNCATQTKTTCKAKCSKCGLESETLELQGACDYDPDPNPACKHNYSAFGTVVIEGNCENGIPSVYKLKCTLCNVEHPVLMIQEPCAVSIKPTPIDSKYGIKLAKNIVSDNAVINVIAPEKVIETKVVVYDAIGNIVFNARVNGSQKITWDLRNNSGRFVANGGYLVIAEVKGISGKTYPFSAKLGVNR